MVQKLSKIRTSLVSVKTGSVKSFENAYRGVATGGTRAARGLWHPHFNFPTKKGSTVSVSNIRDIVFYECSETMLTRNFTIYRVCYNFLTIYGSSSFFLTT